MGLSFSCPIEVLQTICLLGICALSSVPLLFVSLLCFHENLPGFLYPGLESSAEKRRGPAGDGPEGHRDDQMDEKPLL